MLKLIKNENKNKMGWIIKLDGVRNVYGGGGGVYD